MKKVIQTKNAPAPIGPYNQAILVNQVLYISGQIAMDPRDGKLVLSSIAEESKQVMENLKAILEAAGMGFEAVIKSSIFLKDMNDFDTVNQVYGHYFNADSAPARECVQVVQLPKKVNVEISMIAAKQ